MTEQTKPEKKTRQPGEPGSQPRGQAIQSRKFLIQPEAYAALASYADKSGHTMTVAFYLMLDQYYRDPNRAEPVASPKRVERSQLRVTVPKAVQAQLKELMALYGVREVDVIQAAIEWSTGKESSND